MKIKLIYILIINTLLCKTWEIDAENSYIEYLGEHRLHSWIGKTKTIDFRMPCKNDSCNLEIATPLESFSSGNDGRDSNMLYYTESLLYPNVTFISNPFTFSGKFANEMEIKGNLTFHGITKEIKVKIKLYENELGAWGECDFSIDLSSFNVERPSLLLMKIKNEIYLTSKLKFLEKTNEK